MSEIKGAISEQNPKTVLKFGVSSITSSAQSAPPVTIIPATTSTIPLPQFPILHIRSLHCIRTTQHTFHNFLKNVCSCADFFSWLSN